MTQAKLLLTGTVEDLNFWNSTLAPYHLAPLHAPMFKIQVSTAVCAAACRTQVIQPSFAIVTSQYGAAALPLEFYQQFTHIFVIGQTTQQSLPQGAVLPIICPSVQANSESLFTYILQQDLPKNVTLIQGENAHPYLRQALVAQGFLVTYWPVYQRVPILQFPAQILESIQTNSLRYAWFNSVSASEIFWQLLPVAYRQQWQASCILCVGSARIADFWNTVVPLKAEVVSRQGLLDMLHTLQ